MGRRFLAALLALTAAPASAWSYQGHYTTGAIAHDDLAAAQPKLVATIEQIMAAHPDKARFDKALGGLTGPARTRRLFELMASWPDDARDGPYDHPGWHYWLRLVPSTADPANVPPQYLKATTGQAADAYALMLATLHDAFAPAPERAIALCWVFHLAGDIQQPLHAGHLISGLFPMSDKAGGAAFVKRAPGAAAGDLHQFWDHAIDREGDDAEQAEARRVQLERALPRAALPELDGRADVDAFRRWADESLTLARTTAYVNGTFEGAISTEAAQSVSAAYLAESRRLGERRIALGGYRIADAVRFALAPAP